MFSVGLRFCLETNKAKQIQFTGNVLQMCNFKCNSAILFLNYKWSKSRLFISVDVVEDKPRRHRKYPITLTLKSLKKRMKKSRKLYWTAIYLSSNSNSREQAFTSHINLNVNSVFSRSHAREQWNRNRPSEMTRAGTGTKVNWGLILARAILSRSLFFSSEKLWE